MSDRSYFKSDIRYFFSILICHRFLRTSFYKKLVYKAVLSQENDNNNMAFM